MRMGSGEKTVLEFGEKKRPREVRLCDQTQAGLSSSVLIWILAEMRDL